MALTYVGARDVLRQPATVRWVGFTGSALLGISAFVGGAFPFTDINTSPFQLFDGPNGALIVTLWAFGITGLVGAWLAGRHFIGRGILTTRWVIVTATLWMLPMLVCPPIGSRDVYAYACQGALVAAGHSPYQEGVAALPCQWLDSVSVIWRDTPAPYGSLFLMIAGLAAKTGSLAAAIVVFRLLAVIGVAMIALFLPMLARRVGVPVDRALWLVLACPLVVVHLIGGGHNDALAIGLLLAGFTLLAGRPNRTSALVLGGVLIGFSIAVKTTIGAVLPFGVFLAAGGPALPALGILVRKAVAVMGAALATVLGLAWGSGLGMFGWITSLSHAGLPDVWTSPPSAVGIAVNYLERPFGLHYNTAPIFQFIAIIALPIVLLAIVWHSRNHDPLYGAGLAMLATIFLAPIVQSWYLVWPLALFAATRARIRWFAIAVAFLALLILPDGTSVAAIVKAPMSFVMTGIVVWTVVRGFTWLRGYEPKEIDFGAPRTATAAGPAYADLRGSGGPALSHGTTTSDRVEPVVTGRPADDRLLDDRLVDDRPLDDRSVDERAVDDVVTEAEAIAEEGSVTSTQPAGSTGSAD